MILDHNIVMQLWNDPFFWEMVPELEDDREIAEALLVNAEAEQSSLSIRHSQLYNKWILLIGSWVTTRPAAVRQITDYMHKKRGYRPEVIKLPSGMILSSGHGATQ
jgi:hypothetical protein